MCGIIGYTGRSSALEVLIQGLYALEYRGYDSAGVAFYKGRGQTAGERVPLCVVKSAGRISALEEKLEKELHTEELVSFCGIGHTRWATHGEPTDANAHPHGTAQAQIVHNGIIENYAQIREYLTRTGYSFSSQTDTEAAALLIDYMSVRYDTHEEALRAAAAEFQGSYAICAVFQDEPGTIYAIRRDNPLIIGVGNHEYFTASDITAILTRTRDYYRMEDGELAIITPTGVTFTAADGEPVHKELQTADWDVEAAQRGGYDHFMLKEIYEGPDALRKTLHAHGASNLAEEGLDEARLAQASSLTVVACGTALNAGILSKIFFEKYAHIPVYTEVASEFRYRNPILGDKDIVLVISQSGETADTLAALRLARKRGIYTIAMVNVTGSSIAREADCTIYTCAGPEIAVASTKAYSVQTALLADLAVRLGMLRGVLSGEAGAELRSKLLHQLPAAISSILESAPALCRTAAQSLKDVHSIFYIGRGPDCSSAQEAALKMKEISYIHCEAYAAGEMKHGTISLIEADVPVVALCTAPSDSVLRSKMIGNIREVQTRGAFVLYVGTQRLSEDLANVQIILPAIDPDLAPIAGMTVLQLLAYYTAVARGTDVDKPRNLAKSVTVE